MLDHDRELRMEYERGKAHGAEDLSMSQAHCRLIQLELNEARAQIGRLKMELAKMKRGGRGVLIG